MSWHDCRYTVDLVGSQITSKRSSPETCVLSRFLGSILLAEWTDNPSYGGLRTPFLEARYQHSCSEAACVTKCLQFATNEHSHVCKKQIHEDFGVQSLRQNVIELTERFDSKFASMGDTAPLLLES